ncbi:MAG: hypothetical protein WCO56_15605 [Verrucomicrobiota bacterium]
MSANSETFPPPNNPDDFESLCLDLWKDIWNDPGAQKNGRSGQPQAGVDVFGQKDGRWIGVQCKQKDGLLRSKLTVKDLETEVAYAREFKPPLSAFILATTGPADVKVQQRARELTDENRAIGLFTIEVWSWEKIWHEIYGREELLRRIGPVYWPRSWKLIEERLGPNQPTKLISKQVRLDVSRFGLTTSGHIRALAYFWNCYKRRDEEPNSPRERARVQFRLYLHILPYLELCLTVTLLAATFLLQVPMESSWITYSATAVLFILAAGLLIGILQSLSAGLSLGIFVAYLGALAAAIQGGLWAGPIFGALIGYFCGRFCPPSFGWWAGAIGGVVTGASDIGDGWQEAVFGAVLTSFGWFFGYFRLFWQLVHLTILWYDNPLTFRRWHPVFLDPSCNFSFLRLDYLLIQYAAVNRSEALTKIKEFIQQNPTLRSAAFRAQEAILQKDTLDWNSRGDVVEARPSSLHPLNNNSIKTPMKKTIVELDLKGYSDLARELEENLSVDVVASLNEQIQGFVKAGLKAVSISWDQAVLGTAGDNAFVIFDQAEQAHHFAKAVHESAQANNAGKTVSSAKRWFRIGAATGEISISVMDGQRKVAGITIANAVRLEAAAGSGEFLVDLATFRALPSSIQQLYGKEETVEGKRKEKFQARRCVMIPVELTETCEPTIESILDLFDQLNPRDQLQRLMLLIRMPENFRPAEALELHKRQNKILDWAAGQNNGLKRLETALRTLIDKQSRPT